MLCKSLLVAPHMNMYVVQPISWNLYAWQSFQADTNHDTWQHVFLFQFILFCDMKLNYNYMNPSQDFFLLKWLLRHMRQHFPKKNYIVLQFMGQKVWCHRKLNKNYLIWIISQNISNLHVVNTVVKRSIYMVWSTWNESEFYHQII